MVCMATVRISATRVGRHIGDEERRQHHRQENGSHLRTSLAVKTAETHQPIDGSIAQLGNLVRGRAGVERFSAGPPGVRIHVALRRIVVEPCGVRSTAIMPLHIVALARNVRGDIGVG